MAYYCGECVVWVGSSDVDRYGRRWCSYSRRYEESNQETYGCRGFVYNGRTILTKICEIMNLPVEKWFESFDAVKDAYVAPQHIEWLTSYCGIGPRIAKAIDADENRQNVAKRMLNDFLKPAYQLWEKSEFQRAAMCYRQMVMCLMKLYL